MGEMGRVREKTEVVYETSERYAQRVVVVDAELGLFVAQVVDHDACEVGDAYRMLLARMRRRRVHERAPTQLLDLAETLELGRVHHRDQQAVELHGTVDAVVDGLALAALRHRRTPATTQPRSLCDRRRRVVGLREHKPIKAVLLLLLVALVAEGAGRRGLHAGERTLRMPIRSWRRTRTFRWRAHLSVTGRHIDR